MSTEAYRQKCLNEKGEQCDNCGSTENIEVHHIDGDRTNDDLDNLLPLCRDCHSRLHRSGLGGLEDELLPVEDRPQIDTGATAFQISCRCDDWEAWKNTVPRSKSLEQRILELIEADTEGRVGEAVDVPLEDVQSSLETAATALQGQDPDTEIARREIEAALEEIGDG